MGVIIKLSISDRHKHISGRGLCEPPAKTNFAHRSVDPSIENSRIFSHICVPNWSRAIAAQVNATFIELRYRGPTQLRYKGVSLYRSTYKPYGMYISENILFSAASNILPPPCQSDGLPIVSRIVFQQPNHLSRVGTQAEFRAMNYHCWPQSDVFT